ncbi:Hypothetical protein NTJ_07514 [Nesidiocoris tenuis]|uniref:Uncharacterized protein n=1 Tax=Nesidiocoris tenuis TaxID=355587 RepID=A0ABN7AR59_9HEMI|nr:Hypothetical protein NTJ_07514 [Nesidiocoris tenuis]
MHHQLSTSRLATYFRSRGGSVKAWSGRPPDAVISDWVPIPRSPYQEAPADANQPRFQIIGMPVRQLHRFELELPYQKDVHIAV